MGQPIRQLERIQLRRSANLGKLLNLVNNFIMEEQFYGILRGTS